tara:strand:+ start:1804 stop:3426 length:1623 start_codon:yes stop_codon:yes gene_type:complete
MVTQPTHKKLSSGIQSFTEVSPDYEMAPIGIASIQKQAEKLAEYGRNGDIYIVHAAEGETVIPMEVLNANPQIKALLFNQMTEMGLDPQEFVVGNELNSINPDTGLPEFFFSKIFRKVKRAAKKAFGAAKKIAPYAIPIALSVFGGPAFLGTAFGPGSLGAAALGGGLGSLAGGGSLKDAFKAAAVSAGTSALLSGGQSMLGGKSFGQGVSDAFTGSNLPSQTTQLQRLSDGNLGDLMLRAPEDADAGFLYGGYEDDYLKSNIPMSSAQQVSKNITLPATSNVSAALGPADSGLSVNKLRQYTPLAQPTFKPSGGEALFGDAAVTAAKDAAYNQGVNKILNSPFGLTADPGDRMLTFLADNAGKAAEKAVTAKSLAPSLMQQYGPLAAAGGLAAYAGGAFDPVPVEEVSEQDLPGYVDSDYVKGGNNPLYEANPGKYKVADINPYRYAPSSYPRVPSGMFSANKGGYMNKQPRNNELPQFAGYVRGPGTTTSDSIPGYLSDKEFVFNAESVAGADPSGRGDYNAGASNLYNLMRNLQMRA